MYERYAQVEYVHKCLYVYRKCLLKLCVYMNEQYHYMHACMYVCKMDIYIQSMTFAAALLDLSSSCAAFLFPFLPSGQGLHTAHSMV